MAGSRIRFRAPSRPHRAGRIRARRERARAGERLIDSEIVKIQAFAGPDGKFNENAYRAALAPARAERSEVRERHRERAVRPAGHHPHAGPRPAAPAADGALRGAARERRHGEIEPAAERHLRAPRAIRPRRSSRASITTIAPITCARERRVIRYSIFGAERSRTCRRPPRPKFRHAIRRQRLRSIPQRKAHLTQLVVPTKRRQRRSSRSRQEANRSISRAREGPRYRLDRPDGRGCNSAAQSVVRPMAPGGLHYPAGPDIRSPPAAGSVSTWCGSMRIEQAPRARSARPRRARKSPAS